MYKPSGRDVRYLNKAYEIAKTSLCNQRHGAVVIRNGNVVSFATNKDINLVDNLDEKHVKTHASIHAEVAALSKVANPRGCTVYVSRALKSGGPGHSKPCVRCQKYLDEAGVKRVVWT